MIEHTSHTPTADNNLDDNPDSSNNPNNIAKPSQSHDTDGSTPVAINLEIETIKLILSEKRTSLAVLRTGIAILVLPLSILSALIATSKLYEPQSVMGMLLVVFVINGLLTGVGLWLIAKSFLKMRRCNHVIHQMQKHHPALKNLMV
ncbi:MAG: hypothetical protein Q4G13_03140 [Moraxella sp.]|nr:hypothetical protein [Moraxella sp.]